MWQTVIDRVAGEISTHIRQGSYEALIRLEPPELGRLKIDLVVEGGTVQARIVAEEPNVGALIQTHLPELKHALQSQNLELGTVRVDVNGGNGEGGDSLQGFRQESAAPHHQRNGEQQAAAQGGEKRQRERQRRAHLEQAGSINVWA